MKYENRDQAGSLAWSRPPSDIRFYFVYSGDRHFVHLSEDHPNSFFADWMRDWRRRLVIGKALSAIRDELADSARRTKRAHVHAAPTSRPNWSAISVVTKADLERALLGMDVFPRAALLLLVFEGMPIPDVATLLDADPALVKKAQAIGLRELTASLAPTRPRAFSGVPCHDPQRTRRW